MLEIDSTEINQNVFSGKILGYFMTDNGSLLPHLKDSLELAHLARSQHFTENQHFLPPLTY